MCRFLGHLSHSGDLLLWVGVRRRASSVVRRPSFVVRRALTSSPQKLLCQSLPNLVCSIIRGSRLEIVVMMTKEGSTKIVYFMTPGVWVLVIGCGHISYRVKMHYFFKNLFFNSQALIRQTKYVVMMTKEGSTKILNFMTPWVGVLVLGRGHISHRVKMHYFFKNLLLYSQA